MPGPSIDDDALMRSFLERRADLIAYLRAIASADLAEDAFQETFLVVHRRLADFRRDGDFHAWVRGIARNVVRQVARRHDRLRLLPADGLVDLIDRTLDEAEADREPAGVDALRRCIERLGEPQRRLLQLRYAQNHPMEAIARELGRSAGAVQVALSRLRSALAGCLARRETA